MDKSAIAFAVHVFSPHSYLVNSLSSFENVPVLSPSQGHHSFHCLLAIRAPAYRCASPSPQNAVLLKTCNFNYTKV